MPPPGRPPCRCRAANHPCQSRGRRPHTHPITSATPGDVAGRSRDAANVVFDFDTWPGLPTFVEIEGPAEASVRQAAATFGLDYAQAQFGSVDEICKSEIGATSYVGSNLTHTTSDCS
jgi:hypothetical protein